MNKLENNQKVSSNDQDEEDWDLDQESQKKMRSLNGITRGLQVGIEFAGGPVFGIILGLFIDKQFDTSPLFTIIFLFLGFGAGILNIYRLINNLDASIGVYKQISEKKKDKKNG